MPVLKNCLAKLMTLRPLAHKDCSYFARKLILRMVVSIAVITALNRI